MNETETNLYFAIQLQSSSIHISGKWLTLKMRADDVLIRRYETLVMHLSKNILYASSLTWKYVNHAPGNTAPGIPTLKFHDKIKNTYVLYPSRWIGLFTIHIVNKSWKKILKINQPLQGMEIFTLGYQRAFNEYSRIHPNFLWDTHRSSAIEIFFIEHWSNTTTVLIYPIINLTLSALRTYIVKKIIAALIAVTLYACFPSAMCTWLHREVKQRYKI